MPKKILVVDDEKDLVEIIEFCLEANNYIVITAFDGRQGLEKVEKEKPDLIILDFLMPTMDGFDMALALEQKGLTGTIPIIYLTVLLNKEDARLRNKIIGDNIILSKPFDDDELLTKVKKALGT